MEVFQDYAYYYNSFYKDKNYSEEANQVDTILKRYGKNIKSVINFGCGTGNHDIELIKLGYDMEGIDLSNSMIEVAKRNIDLLGMVEKFSVADVRSYVPQKKYDAVVSLFHVMSYQNRNEDILCAFKSARNCLSKDGIFLFDVWYGPGVLTDLPMVRVKEVEDDRYKLTRIARPILNDKTSIVDVCYEVLITSKEDNVTKILNEVHNMRYFFRPELELMLNMSDFELIDNIDCNSLNDTNYDSWTSYFIAKAR